MADYQRTVEFLRDFRMSPVQTVTDEVRRYAADYAELCQQANERLRQCSAFLQQGLRTEAIHLAEAAPNLLDVVAALDLPDAQRWIEFCQQNDLPAPPPLMIDRATQLNDAYSQEEPLDNLLRQHRRLALCRAPLKDRLRVMREVATLDAGSGFWDKDIRTFEKARMRELKIQLSAAVRNSDESAIAAMSAEVLQSPWLEPLIPDLHESASNIHNRRQIQEADETMQKLLPQLREAFAARAHAECAALVGQIKELLAAAPVHGVNSDVAVELKPILEWIGQEDDLLAKQKAFEAACADLGRAMDADTPDSQLEPIYEKMRGFQLRIPDELENRYRTFVEKRASAAQRRHHTILAAIAAVLLLAFGIGYVVIQRVEAKGWADRIQQAVRERNLPKARQIIQAQEKDAPQFTNSPGVAAARKQFALLQVEYDRDASDLRVAVAALQEENKAVDQMLKSAGKSIDDLLAEEVAVRQSLDRLSSGPDLTWVDEDRKLPAEVAAVKPMGDLLHDKAVQLFKSQAEDLGHKLEAIANSPDAAADSGQTPAIEAIGSQISDLHRFASISPDAKGILTALDGQYEQKRQLLAQDAGELEDLHAICTRTATVDGLKKSLQDFVTRFPKATLTPDFTSALTLLDGAVDIDAWRQLSASWTGQMPPTSDTAAKAQVTAIESYLEDHPHSPCTAIAQMYTGYLQKAASAMAVKSVWETDFHDLLSAPMICDLEYLQSSDGSRYMVLGDPKLDVQRMNEKLFITFQAIDPQHLAKHKLVHINPPAYLTTDKPQLLPHALFARDMAVRLKQVTPDNWDSLGIGLIEQLVADQDMDLVVKCVLLEQLLQTETKVAGWGLGDIYDRSMKDLARQGCENIVWYDPDHPVPAVTIATLTQIIDSIPPSAVVMKKLQAGRTSLFNQVRWNYPSTGVLMRNSGGDLVLYTNAADVDGEVAVAAGPVPSAEPQVASLVLVGRYAGGKWVFDPAARDLPQGTMVYVGKP